MNNVTVIKHEHLLFPVYVAHYSNFLKEEQLNNIYNFCLNEKTSEHPAITGNATSNHAGGSDIFNLIETKLHNCKGLNTTLYSIINDYASSLGLLGKIAISNSWFNIQNTGSILIDHIHPGSLFSGALYVNVDDDSSKLYFKNPNNFLIHLHEQDSHIDPNSRNYLQPNCWIKPKIGDLIIFPSWLYHGSSYKENNTVNRVVLSFNTQYENRRV
jgi:uncharacterized protein (TIGR02466 family)